MGQVARWKTTSGENEIEWRLKLTLGYGLALDDRGEVVAAGLTDGTANLYRLPTDLESALERRQFSAPEDAFPDLR